MGTKIKRKIADHNRLNDTQCSVCGFGPPTMSERVAFTNTLTGWCSANQRNQLGIVAAGTNAVEANVRGNKIGNAINCAVSLLGAFNPMKANAHEIENAKIRSNTKAMR